mgnify:CR=1 FL=1
MSAVPPGILRILAGVQAARIVDVLPNGVNIAT